MYEIYTVNGLDTLGDIALRCGSSVEELNRINGFDDDISISDGMQMIIPVVPDNPFTYYTVKKGDNLYDIAKKSGIDYKVLMLINGLDDSDYIYPNQSIMIPKKNIGIYLTNNDTIDSVLDKLDIELDELISNNNKIFLRDEQIIIFKKK